MLLTRMIHIARRMGFKNAYTRMKAIFNDTSKQGLLQNLYLFVHISTNLFSYLFGSLPKQSKLPLPNYNKIITEFESNNIAVERFLIDVDDFREFTQQYQFTSDYINSHKDVFTEKALEHYLSRKFLKTSSGDVFIDVASADSPWAEMLTEKEAVKAYSLDLCHENGIHANKIGANVIDIPLPDNSVDSMALHCAFEVFENDSDIYFFKEADRILKNTGGGGVIIVPLYMDNEHYIFSSPFADKIDIIYDEARPAWRDNGSFLKFVRHYDVKSFVNRIVKNANNLSLKLYFIENEKEVHESCYVKFFALFEKNESKRII